MQQLQDPNQVITDDQKTVRHEASKHIRNKKKRNI